MVLGCLGGVWKVSTGCLNVYSRCYEGVCTQLGVWNVSRGFEISLKKVLTAKDQRGHQPTRQRY